MNGSYEIDTVKLLNASSEIKTLLTNLERVSNEYLTCMGKVPNDTKEWQGNASENFVEIIKKDYETELLSLLNSIKKIAAEMETEANEYQKIVNEVIL